MRSRGCIKFAHVESEYNKYGSRDVYLGYHIYCPYTEDEELVVAEIISNTLHTSLNSTQNSRQTDNPYNESYTFLMRSTELALAADTLYILR